MPIPFLIFMAFMVVSISLAPPSIILLAPFVCVFWCLRRRHKRTLQAAARARAEQRAYDQRIAAGLRLCRSVK